MPDTFTVMETLRQRAERQRQLAEQKRLQGEARRMALNQYVGQNLDEKDYDALLGEQLQGVKQKYAQLLTQPGAENMSTADLAVLMGKDLQNLSQWNQGLKQGKEAIATQAKDFKGDGVKQGTLEKAALHNFLYKKDDAGKWTLKSPQELDLSKNWVQETLESTPQFFVDNPDDRSQIQPKASEAFQDADKHTYQNSRGGKVKEDYDIRYFPQWQRLVKPANGRPYVEPRGEFLLNEDGSKVVDPNTKQPIQVAETEVFKNFMKDDTSRLRLLAQFQADNGRRADVKNQGDVDILRHMVYERLPTTYSKKFADDKKDNPIPLRVLYPTPPKERKDDVITPLDYLFGAMSGSKDAVDVMSKLPDGRVNAASALGGWKVLDNKGVQRTLSGVIFDPNKPSAGVHIEWYSKNGTEEVKNEKDLDLPGFKKLIKQSFASNTSSDNMNKVDKILNTWFSGDKLKKQVTEQPPAPGGSFLYRLKSLFTPNN
jgi:hypothetical protein